MPKGGGAVALPLRVVGIGASAGGLEALKLLLAKLPVDSGLAFVVLQHLPPSQTGQLAKLLATSTTMPVLDVKTGQRLLANMVFVVPPHTAAVISRGALSLRTAKSGSRPRLPIDELFGSLAKTLGDRAVGVVLSGTAHDGTEGLRAIRVAGGLTLVQDPSTAQFDQMPRSAIAANVVDVVLPPAAIGEQVGDLSKVPPNTPGLVTVLEQLREASGIDFTSYKRTTIERRLARRLAKHNLATLEEYGAFLAEHPEEVSTVYEDLLIHVTEFFRDAPILDKLVGIFAEAVRDRPADVPLRVWVPGCSTGEEVYSLAILLIEKLGDRRPLQLFGTDLSEKAVDAARVGRYPRAIASKMSAERLEKFFRREDGGYRIKQDVRERCVFARHDLVTDPPFSKLDLVSCRNLLIYLGAPLQKRVIPIVHYALNQDGFLLLGRAETIGDFDTLFTTVDSEARIYARKPGVRATLTFPTAGQLGRLPWQQAALLRSPLDVQRDVDHVLLARYAPPCVLVDENFDILQFRGHTGMYLEPPPGQPQLNLLRMARDGLAAELPLALQRARRTDETVRKEGVVVREHRREHRLDLEVIPVRGPTEGKRHFLVVFEPLPDRASAPKTAKGKAAPGRTVIERLRHELAATKEYLHSVVTQHLATSEELGVANEELQSTNEELQSSNEEIQTAKEELQSSNEELETVNEELQHGNHQLRDANDDLVNVLASIEIAMIIVDTERRVRRFTPRARTVLNLIAGDLGRPIADLQPNLTLTGLDATIAAVIDTLVVHEAEVLDLDGTTCYRMQIRPYLTVDRKISGAVLSFVDITVLRTARNLRTAIVETVPTPIVVLDDRLRIQSSNRAFGVTFQTTEAQVIGRKLLDLGDWNNADLAKRLEGAFRGGNGFDDIDTGFHGDAGVRVLRVSAHSIPQTDGPAMLLVGILDITEREAARLERDAFLDAVSHELRTPLSAILLWAQALRTLDHADPQRVVAIETIIESVRSEARIVDDLLDIALSRSTELAVVVEVADASEIVNRTVESSRNAARAKQVTIESDVARGGRIAVDPRRLAQITSNLVDNAIKFTPAGGTVAVGLTFPAGVMELRVRDTGPGVAPERIAAVFEPFTRKDSSSTRAHAGLGIGLALVRHLVERHGGSIDVTSPGVGRGSTFTVRIPDRSSTS